MARSDGVPRDVDIRVPLTVAELSAVTRAAEQAGVARAVWVRGVVLTQACLVLVGYDVDVSPTPEPVAPDPREPDPRRELAERAQVRRARAKREFSRLLLVEPPLTNRELSLRLGVTAVTVRAWRAKYDTSPPIDGAAEVHSKADQVRKLHAQGLTTAQIAEVLGYTYQVVQTFLSRLKLRANAPRRSTKGACGA